MNPTQLTLGQALIATFCIAAVICLERAFPFILFSKHEPPKVIRFIERYIPPMVMGCLTFYCLKNVGFTSPVSFVPELCGVTVTVLTYLWKHNPLISIFGGTIIYMVLIRVL